MSILFSNCPAFICVSLILSFLHQGHSQGGFIINKVFHDADEWVVEETYLDHKLSGELRNSPGGLTEYGTDLGKYVHNQDIDGSIGICVKLKKNGSWHKIRCPGPVSERLVDTAGRKLDSSGVSLRYKMFLHHIVAAVTTQ